VTDEEGDDGARVRSKLQGGNKVGDGLDVVLLVGCDDDRCV
jgi:hypothetical protein